MKKWTPFAAFLPAVLFPCAAFVIGLRNPAVFEAPRLFSNSPLSAILFVIGFGALLVLRNRSTALQRNFPGLLLFLLFSVGYFMLATIFNKPDINTNNIFFAADNWSWTQRMAAENGGNVGTRAVHPLAHLIFRPLTILLSLFTGGNRFHANLILLALAGGGCVFLTWKILLQVSEQQTFAVLLASLLGLSASHLVFASVIESYIFSTLSLLFFLWLLLNNKPVYWMIATGVLTLGITITNIAQQVLMALFIEKKFRKVAILFTIIVLFGVGLNIVSRFIYPVTEYFFIPGNLTGEQRFSQQISFRRAGLMAENILVYNVTAPQPYASIRNEMPRFNFLGGTISEYTWFGWPALISWSAILVLAFLGSFRDPAYRALSAAMLACLAFNFLLHIGYGIEPFLYSADWTYALVLFVALSLTGFAERAWFNFSLLAIVMIIFVNNLWMIYFLARTVSEFLI
jgi:hypothetical protein